MFVKVLEMLSSSLSNVATAVEINLSDRDKLPNLTDNRRCYGGNPMRDKGLAT